MSYQVSNQELGAKIQEAERSEGFFITVSRLSNGKIYHYYITQHFPREDISKSLYHYFEQTKKESVGSVAGEPVLVEEKILPPEYRGNGQK